MTVKTRRYRVHHLSRKIPCDEHDLLNKTKPYPFVPKFPVVEEEYFEWIDVLESAYQAAVQKRPYYFIELGARYGTWAARAGQAYRLLNPDGEFMTVGLEGDLIGYEWMVEHFKKNGFTEENSKAIHGILGTNSGEMVPIAWEDTTPRPAKTYTFLDMLRDVDHVDMIDSDVQGAELRSIVDVPGVMDALNKKVRYIHFGTHSGSIEVGLLDVFRKNHWAIRVFYPQYGKVQTPYGSVTMNDGALSVVNLRFIDSMMPI